MDLPLQGRAVEVVTFSPFELWLTFPDPAAPETSPGSDYVLRIGGAFRLASSGATIDVHPGMGPHGAYLGLLRRVVQEAVASKDGSLAITFADGDRLEITTDVFEPWHLTAHGQMLISVAGGGLAVWNDRDGVSVPLGEFGAG